MTEHQSTRLEGDTLYVSPATFAAMKDAARGADPDAAAAEALRIAGLTDSQIMARRWRETKIVVEFGNA